jgi:Phosphorylase superfamily.
MRVVLSPGAEASAQGLRVAEAMAGPNEPIVKLSQRGVKNLRRRLSRAEVHAIRGALRADAELLIGYVCAGMAVPGVCPVGVASVMVADHVNLTWWSPLTGPNDDRLGPRFPVVAGTYRPERATAAAGMGSVEGLVAGVRDERRLTIFETQVVVRHGVQAVSGELVAVAILAAHMGLRVAAVVVL